MDTTVPSNHGHLNPNRLPDSHSLASWEFLCIYLGGSSTSFTGRLLELAAKADPGNRSALRRAFPVEVMAWECWVISDPVPTVSELTVKLRQALEIEGYADYVEP